MINYDTTRGSVTVQTDPGPTQSRLTIRQAVESDTGNYTCSASNTKPASIFVFVTEGKYDRGRVVVVVVVVVARDNEFSDRYASLVTRPADSRRLPFEGYFSDIFVDRRGWG